MAKPMLVVENLRKTFDRVKGSPEEAHPAIDDISFTVEAGEFFTLVGPSGCGKTTTLQCISGLETPDSGRIAIAGKDVFNSERQILVPANRRNLGMVFQSYAIWPHLTVFENVAFPLRYQERKLSKAETNVVVIEALQRMELERFAERPTPFLSGGQQQRVALARALVHKPRLLLLDEPLSNLDAKLRDTMRLELRELVKATGITTIYVTHDQTEALSMSDRVLLLRDGRAEQCGSPRDVYQNPASGFTADFMGRSNVLEARITSSLDGTGTKVRTEIGVVECVLGCPVVSDDEPVFVIIRPHAIVFVGTNDASVKANTFDCIVENVTFVGEFLDVRLRCGVAYLRAFLNPYADLVIGQELRIHIPPERCVVVPNPIAGRSERN